MAQKVILVDDIDGGEAAETVSFAFEGVAYELDLSAENKASLRDALAPYVGVARKADSARGGQGRDASRRTSRSSSSGAGGRTAEIREWARANGHNVNERGRVPSSIVEAYDKAHA